ncbi:endonuclease III [bacterium]|nr:endonuclease III [bacterium]
MSGDFPKAPSKQAATAFFNKLSKLYTTHPLDVTPDDPFRVLVGTILSARTKDPVTNDAIARLWAVARTPEGILAIPEPQLAQLLKPVGFYNAKAKNIHRMCEMLINDFDGEIPRTRDELLMLPGVGRKVANLVLNICFDIPAICVDTHVHRICNRLGWIETETPEQSEFALMDIIDEKHWATLNRVLVNHGQQVCNPVSPWCSRCLISAQCPKIGVKTSR